MQAQKRVVVFVGVGASLVCWLRIFHFSLFSNVLELGVGTVDVLFAIVCEQLINNKHAHEVIHITMLCFPT